MSESERWVLVPREPIWSQEQLNDIAASTVGDPRPLYRKMIGTRPAIPPDVFAAMVERGARAICKGVNEDPDEMWWTVAHSENHPAWMAYIPEATNCLRAALGIRDE